MRKDSKIFILSTFLLLLGCQNFIKTHDFLNDRDAQSKNGSFLAAKLVANYGLKNADDCFRSALKSSDSLSKIVGISFNGIVMMENGALKITSLSFHGEQLDTFFEKNKKCENLYQTTEPYDLAGGSLGRPWLKEKHYQYSFEGTLIPDKKGSIKAIEYHQEADLF